MTTMTEPTKRHYSTTETAKLIRAELKEAFPGVKFSVRSSHYAGGSSVRVSWTDGPTTPDVDGVVNRFQGSDFDGMTDMKSYRDDVLLANDDGSLEIASYGPDFVMVNRSHSDERRAAVEAEVRDFLGEDFERTDRLPMAHGRDGELAHDRYGSGVWASQLVDELLYARAA